MPEMDRGQTLQQAITIANGISVAAGNLQTTLSSITMGDMPDDVANPQQSLDFMQQQMAMLNELGESVNNAATQMSYLQQNVEMLSNSAITVQDAQQSMIAAPQAEQPMAASGTFNLKKVGQFLPPQQPIPQPVQPQVQTPVQPQEGIPTQNAEPIEELKFMDSAELRDWMEQQNDSMFVREKLLNEADEEGSDLIADLVKRFFETEIEEQKLDYAEEIWDNMPNSIKKESPQVQENVMPAHYVSPKSKAAETVQEANDSIKKLAQADAKKATTFNLHKTAQAKSMENVILYGPGQTYVDPFTRQPASEWSIVERNKGFGLVVDDVWNIDWERVWRQNVMDKYSRPYRDGNGDWVGGYIQKRFEVDKWIPEKNNLQLKPGQLRKDYIPEERLIETRMVAQRASSDSPYKSDDKSKPFNWKEASSRKQAGLSNWDDTIEESRKRDIQFDVENGGDTPSLYQPARKNRQLPGSILNREIRKEDTNQREEHEENMGFDSRSNNEKRIEDELYDIANEWVGHSPNLDLEEDIESQISRMEDNLTQGYRGQEWPVSDEYLAELRNELEEFKLQNPAITSHPDWTPSTPVGRSASSNKIKTATAPFLDEPSYTDIMEDKIPAQEKARRDLIKRKKMKIRERNKDKTMVGGPPKSEHFRHKPEANQETSFNLKEAETKKKS